MSVLIRRRSDEDQELDMLDRMMKVQGDQLNQLIELEKAVNSLNNKLERFNPQPTNQIPMKLTKFQKFKGFFRYILSFNSVRYGASLITIVSGFAYLSTFA